MKSLEKIEAFKAALLGGDDVYDGLLGAAQAALGMAEFTGKDLLAELPEDPAELDRSLLEVAGFVLWLRSDDAPAPNVDELRQMPALIERLVAETGIIG